MSHHQASLIHADNEPVAVVLITHVAERALLIAKTIRLAFVSSLSAFQEPEIAGLSLQYRNAIVCTTFRL